MKWKWILTKKEKKANPKGYQQIQVYTCGNIQKVSRFI